MIDNDYSGKRLCGKDFRGHKLQDAKFDNADIRSVDFTGADLKNASFKFVKAGIAPLYLLTLAIFILFLITVVALILAYSTSLVIIPEGINTLEIVFETCLPAGIILFVLSVILRQGIGASLSFLSLSIAVLVPILAAVAQYEPGSVTELLISQVAGRAIGLMGMIAGIVLSGAVVTSVLVIYNRSVLATLLLFVIPIAVAAINEGIGDHVNYIDWPLALVTNILVFAISVHLGFRAFKGDDKFWVLRFIAIRFAVMKGTRFNKANLTNVDLTEASLKNTDFSSANLTRTRLFGSKWLELALTQGTYLDKVAIRKLIVSGEGQNRNFEHQNLQGVNLYGAKLNDSNFIGADLSNADLRNANLSRAKLVQTQLYCTNLSGATLTGAYIQDWAISIDTELTQVHCDYVHMHFPTQDDPDPGRKPDNRQETFAEGEFTDFISPILKTLSLYQQQNVDMLHVAATHKTLDLFHHEGLDPSAATIALKQLAEQFPEAGLEVMALEGRGNERVRVQAKVTGEADRSQLSKAYFTQYQQVESMAYGDIQALMQSIEEKDERIRSLESMVMSALKEEKYYVESVYQLSGNEEEKEPIVKTTILILAANPKGTNPLRLGEEVSSIQKGLERSKDRDRFRLEQRWAVTTADIRRALLDCQPQIVHFSGHGIGVEISDAPNSSARDIAAKQEATNQPEGLVFEDHTGQPHLVSTEAIATLFSLFADKIECVVLNACYSATQADAIAEHIPYVVGMKRAIGDRAAIEFSIGFYDGLLAGKSIEFAFEMGRSSIQMEGIPEHLTPSLRQKLNEDIET